MRVVPSLFTKLIWIIVDKSRSVSNKWLSQYNRTYLFVRIFQVRWWSKVSQTDHSVYSVKEPRDAFKWGTCQEEPPNQIQFEIKQYWDTLWRWRSISIQSDSPGLQTGNLSHLSAEAQHCSDLKGNIWTFLCENETPTRLNERKHGERFVWNGRNPTTSFVLEARIPIEIFVLSSARTRLHWKVTREYVWSLEEIHMRLIPAIFSARQPSTIQMLRCLHASFRSAAEVAPLSRSRAHRPTIASCQKSRRIWTQCWSGSTCGVHGKIAREVALQLCPGLNFRG